MFGSAVPPGTSNDALKLADPFYHLPFKVFSALRDPGRLPFSLWHAPTTYHLDAAQLGHITDLVVHRMLTVVCSLLRTERSAIAILVPCMKTFLDISPENQSTLEAYPKYCLKLTLLYDIISKKLLVRQKMIEEGRSGSFCTPSQSSTAGLPSGASNIL
ncbi:unnamed protein product [Cyclocybe aegerita]|uniref:Uncharacterized protein n=1 Tax=Cyclocybe aegerita TaxID=1973307 RepID=A0A8S0WWK2_CYCAE|nr:unnamed protein product [Cyclocybe aegerita]